MSFRQSKPRSISLDKIRPISVTEAEYQFIYTEKCIQRNKDDERKRLERQAMHKALCIEYALKKFPELSEQEILKLVEDGLK